MLNLASWVFFLNLCYIAYLAQLVVINVVTRVDSCSMRQGLGDLESCEAESVTGLPFPIYGQSVFVRWASFALLFLVGLHLGGEGPALGPP